MKQLILSLILIIPFFSHASDYGEEALIASPVASYQSTEYDITSYQAPLVPIYEKPTDENIKVFHGITTLGAAIIARYRLEAPSGNIEQDHFVLKATGEPLNIRTVHGTMVGTRQRPDVTQIDPFITKRLEEEIKKYKGTKPKTIHLIKSGIDTRTKQCCCVVQ